MNPQSKLEGSAPMGWVIISLLAFALSLASCKGATVVTDALLNRVAWAESRNNPRAVGKLGEAGEFQLREIAIREVNRVKNKRYKLSDAWNRVKAREIARLYLLICESRIKNPTPERVYLKYRGAI